MDLLSINKRLGEIKDELPIALKKLAEIEYKYNLHYFNTLQHSPAGSQDRRDSEAILAANTDGLYKPFLDAKIEVRTLINEKEILTEISRNIRSMRGDE